MQLAVPPDTQTDSQLRCKEPSLEFEKTKRGWVVGPMQEAAQVKREVALQSDGIRCAAVLERARSIQPGNGATRIPSQAALRVSPGLISVG
jgi:hypothetical protein